MDANLSNRKMVWITYVPPEQETKPDTMFGESGDVDGYRIKLYRPFEPAPTVEVRNLFRKIYGEPQDCGEPNPYVAEFTRIRGRLMPVCGNGKDSKKIYGTVDFRYWPTLKLGYIENAQVNPEVRRKGLGSKLIVFAMNYLRNMGSEKIYAYAASRAEKALKCLVVSALPLQLPTTQKNAGFAGSIPVDL